MKKIILNVIAWFQKKERKPFYPAKMTEAERHEALKWVDDSNQLLCVTLDLLDEAMSNQISVIADPTISTQVNSLLHAAGGLEALRAFRANFEFRRQKAIERNSREINKNS
jgi:hypothetical protein